MITNKKGQTTTFRKIAIMVLILIVLTIIFSNIMGGSVNSLKCTRNKGVCSDSCDRFTQYQFIGGKGGGCSEDQVCCINVTQPKPADPRCSKLKEGAECDKSLMICDPALQCVSKCEYCSKNYGTTIGSSICNKPETTNIFAIADKNNQRLSCACTASECSGKSTCINNYCPGAEVCCTVAK